MYSINLQESTGLWVVVDGSGKNVSRGDTPLIAINRAISTGMPSSFKDPLIIEADTVEKKSQEALDARLAADEAARNAREEANAKPPNDLGGTPASDDAKNDSEAAAQIASKENPESVAGGTQNPVSTPEQTDIISKSFAGTTQAGGSNISTEKPITKAVARSPKPGTRLKNPLGNFSSYTYQLSLYMITPDAHTAFVANGRKDINAFAKSGADSGSGGAYLILQSGGINNTLSQRPPGMNLDYYIDDLRITNVVSTQQTATSSNITKITFNIIEPIGFSLTTKLKRAREALAKASKIPNIEKATNASKQFFVLGIRFQGYDANGQIANASKYFSDDTFNKSSDASGVYERFYDILFEKVSFKLTGGATIYSVTAKNIAAEVGLHVARGTVDANIELVADTVGNALNGSGKGINSLFKTMNSNLEKSENAKNREFPDVYDVRWIGDGADDIKNAMLKSPADPDKKKSPSSTAQNSSQVNDATSERTAYDKQKIKISITQGMSVLQAIEKIIKQSTYMTDAMKTLFLSEETPSEDTASPEKKEQKDTPVLRWYNVSPEIEVIGFDTKINDFAYKITYVIQPYDTPAAASPYGRSAKYYGPHKRYEYWYTGKNSEIISYEQQFDNAFFNITFNPNGDPAASGGDAKVAQIGNKKTGQDSTGKISPGVEAENTYMTSLFDPGAYAQARMQILGDPDYLMREAAPGINEVYKQFYQDDNYTINPNGGQVFVEVSFNEGIDYDINSGTMDINDSIFFWDYPDNVRNKIKGVSYQVRECESVFKGGRFTQTLQMNINTMPDAVDAAEKAVTDRTPTNTTNNTNKGDVRTGTTQAGSTPTPGTNTNNSSGGTGLAEDIAPSLTSATQRVIETTTAAVNNALGGTGITLTGNAANPIVASGELEAVGKTIAGIANNVEAAGREISNRVGNILPSTRTNQTSTPTVNFNATDGV